METKFHVRSFDSQLSPEEFRNVPRIPVVAVLDNLRSAFNVGSILRAADCARIRKVFHVGYTAHPPNAKLEKTALGTIPYVPWEHTLSVETALAQVRSENIPIIALETTDRSKPLWEVRFPLPVCLVVGNEALGVSRAALRLSDQVVEIPMLGFKNSINVAVAFGIAVYEIQRQHWAEIQKQAGLPNAPSGSAG